MFRRFFALLYDRIIQPAETAGLSQERQKLLAQASGETVEIGPAPASTWRTTWPRSPAWC